MSSTQSISFRKRSEADEVYTFPYEVRQPTFQTNNAVVMIESQGDGQVLIIAGNLPGVGWHYDNYPDVDGEDKREKQNLSEELVAHAKDCLSEYDPDTSTSTANSGNRTLKDIYVTVGQEERDAVVVKMWQMLHDMRDRYIQMLQKSSEEEYHRYPSLEDEILEISTRYPTDEK